MPLGLSQILSQTIDIDSSWELNNSLAVIHYPHKDRRSILQGIIPLTLNWNEDVLARCWGSDTNSLKQCTKLNLIPLRLCDSA